MVARDRMALVCPDGMHRNADSGNPVRDFPNGIASGGFKESLNIPDRQAIPIRVGQGLFEGFPKIKIGFIGISS